MRLTEGNNFYGYLPFFSPTKKMFELFCQPTDFALSLDEGQKGCAHLNKSKLFPGREPHDRSDGKRGAVRIRNQKNWMKRRVWWGGERLTCFDRSE